MDNPTRNKNDIKKLCAGFSRLTREEREKRLYEMGYISLDDIELLKKGNALTDSLAEHFVENVISTFQLPLGVAVNFEIDDKPYIIPMAVEETSVIAGLSKTAKWIREQGKITTENVSHLGIGQIHIPKVKDFDNLENIIEKNKLELIENAHKEVAFDIVSRGGGIHNIIARKIGRGDGSDMAVLHVLMDTRDAMGANIINQACEYLKPRIESLANEKAGMCILTNLADTKVTRANVIINNIDPELGEAISEASLFAQHDPYRAATSNKGVMNGIDAVLIATGNDWRAVEAGVHAYAARLGQYTSVTRWFMQDKSTLCGELEAPILVGIVGGMTRLHPMAKLCLKILGLKTSSELARIVAAVGLVQNLAAVNALVTQGITKGHMKLHITNLALASGAQKNEMPVLKERLAKRLEERRFITETDVKELLGEMRKK